MQLDVFTLVPHAFAWLTEQRPVATVLGTELDLRLFSYRDTTPLRAGAGRRRAVRRRRRHGAARGRRRGRAGRGVRRRARPPRHRADAAGPAADAGRRRGARRRGAAHAAVRPLRGLRRARRRSISHRTRSRSARTSSRAASFPRWCSSMRSRAGCRARSRGVGRVESFSAELDGGLEYPHYTRPAEFRGWRVPECCCRATTERSTSGGASRAGGGRLT